MNHIQIFKKDIKNLFYISSMKLIILSELLQNLAAVYNII